MDLDDLFNAAVDAAWAYATARPGFSFTGACRAAAAKAVVLYQEHFEMEKERQCALLDRIAELEKALNLVGHAVTLNHDEKLPSGELSVLVGEVRLRMDDLQSAKQQLFRVTGQHVKTQQAIDGVLRLMENKEQMRRRFRADAHWIRFIRSLRLLLVQEEK